MTLAQLERDVDHALAESERERQEVMDAITEGLSVEEYIATQQAEANRHLAEIRESVESYLAALAASNPRFTWRYRIAIVWRALRGVFARW